MSILLLCLWARLALLIWLPLNEFSVISNVQWILASHLPLSLFPLPYTPTMVLIGLAIWTFVVPPLVTLFILVLITYLGAKKSSWPYLVSVPNWYTMPLLMHVSKPPWFVFSCTSLVFVYIFMFSCTVIILVPLTILLTSYSTWLLFCLWKVGSWQLSSLLYFFHWSNC